MPGKSLGLQDLGGPNIYFNARTWIMLKLFIISKIRCYFLMFHKSFKEVVQTLIIQLLLD